VSGNWWNLQNKKFPDGHLIGLPLALCSTLRWPMDCQLVSDSDEGQLRSTDSSTPIVRPTYSQFGDMVFGGSSPEAVETVFQFNWGKLTLVNEQLEWLLKTYLSGMRSRRIVTDRLHTYLLTYLHLSLWSLFGSTCYTVTSRSMDDGPLPPTGYIYCPYWQWHSSNMSLSILVYILVTWQKRSHAWHTTELIFNHCLSQRSKI